MGFLSPTHLIIILVIVLVIFGPSRLPQLGKSLGKTMKAIREGAEGEPEADEKSAKATAKKVNDNPVDADEE